MEAPPFALYNPALLPPDVLLSEFTARRPLLARLLDIIRANDPGEPAQHVLCVGPRGMGKTTLLCAIAATIKLHEPELAKLWQPVIFDEESRRIGDLADFWLECIRQWESETEPTLTRSHRIDALLAKPGPDIEDKAREVFLTLVDASGKRALLLIDNLNDIFIAVNDAESLMRLRSFLMSDPRVMIIGAATRWFSDVTGLDKPFFEFFRPFDLHALSLEEMRECLAGVATARGDQLVIDALNGRAGSIEALHTLTDGNPRLIRTFYRLINEGMNGELRQQLERLIDDYTPYHKAIIDALPGQQQRVLDAIALEWNPTDVGTVARTTRLPSNQVSAQIKALIKSGIIKEAENLGHSKRKAYLLTDRFSNIHYLMRHGRTGKLKMHWFVMMLRALFGDKEFAEVAAKTVRLTATCGTGLERDSLLLAQNVIDHAGSEEVRRQFMDRITGSREFDEQIDVVLGEKVCRQAIAVNPRDAYAHYKWGRLLDVHLKRYPEAEAAYRRAIELAPDLALSWNNLATLLAESLGRLSEAEAIIRKAIELYPQNGSLWDCLGNLLSNHLGRYTEAENAYRRAVEIDPQNLLAWCNLGVLLSDHFDRLAEAETAFRKAIEIDPSRDRAWNGLGIVLKDLHGDVAGAKAAYLKAIDLNPKGSWQWNNLGILYNECLLDQQEAEASYRKAIELNPSSSKAWLNLGNVLTLNLGRHEEAEAAYHKSIDVDPTYGRAHSCLGMMWHILRCKKIEARREASLGFQKSPNQGFCRQWFAILCFTHPVSLRSVLPDVSHWCTQHPDDQSVLSFMVDAWIAYAKCASASEALEMLDAQPDEVKLAFETVRDAFLAHDDKDHLHRLAPERRAPVLKLLERMKVTNTGEARKE
jgi:tetratricopeptide (TPR) repeat protein